MRLLLTALLLPTIVGAQSVEPSDAGRHEPPVVFELAGLQGLMMPSYDRVDGLSLPIGARVTFGDSVVAVQPSLTYRSRLGVVDPGVSLVIMAGRPVRLEADVARSTRTNEVWLYSDLINSAATIAFGNDTRNYFRADGGTARLIGRVASATTSLEPFVGGRYEKVSPITAAGNVWSFTGRQSIEHMARPNPLVERGTIGSALLGARLRYAVDSVSASFSAEGERSTQTPVGTSAFTQVTLDGAIAFPTFHGQRLSIDGHGVVSSGDSVPLSRYSYLGRGGSFPLLERLEQGGDRLLFIDSRYSIPVPGLTLPYAGYPTLFLRHMIGSAGVGRLPKLEQEIGAGIGVKMLRADVTMDVARKRSASFGVGISLAD